MILGMSVATFTFIHVVLSLIGNDGREQGGGESVGKRGDW